MKDGDAPQEKEKYEFAELFGVSKMTKNARKSGLRVFENNQKSADRLENIKKLFSEGKVEMIVGHPCGDRKGEVERVVKAVKMCLEQAERGGEVRS